MASVAVPQPQIYWCHQCNVQTTPTVDEDILCSICNQGFVEELENTEVEPGVAFSTLGSVGMWRDRTITDAPPSPSSSQQQGQQPIEPQVHPPRILSGQLSGVPSLLEAMMLALEEFGGSPTPSDPGNDFERAFHEDAHPTRQDSRMSRSNRLSGQEDDGHAFALPVPSTLLILHGGMPTPLGLGQTLEVFVDNGEGLGPQMMPGHFRDYFMGPDLDRLIQMLADNDPNRYGTPPAAKFAVEKLLKFKISQEHLESNIEQCAVCKDDFELDVDVLQVPCKHVYHCDCILPWLEQHNSCPVCRYELPTDDADYEARKRQGATTNPSEEVRGRNPDGPHGQGDANNANQGSHPQLSRQFTLWGMPYMGMDPTGLVLGSDVPRLDATLGGQNVPPRDGVAMESGDGADREGVQGNVPVQWLFRLFSSMARENGGNNEANSESQSARGDSSAQ